MVAGQLQAGCDTMAGDPVKRVSPLWPRQDRLRLRDRLIAGVLAKGR